MSWTSLLEKATANNDDPTPGYVYTELAKITHADVMSCDKMVDWLYKKLNASQPAIKWKVLLVMKHVARGGRMDFRRSLQRQNDLVKQCQGFKGPPDPLRGDEPYRKVRDAAKEALEAMFDSNAPPAGSASQLSGRITGSGSVDGAGSGPKYPPPSAFPPTGGSASKAFPPTGGPGGQGSGFSTALPGQPGYDPRSPMHAAPSSSGQMQGFGNYDPNKDKGVGAAIFDKMKSAFTTSTAVPPTHGALQGRAGPGSGNGGGGLMAGGFPPADRSSGSGSFSDSGAGGWAPGGGSTSFGGGDPTRRPGQPGGGWGAPQGQQAQAQGGHEAQGAGRRGRMPAGTAGSSADFGRVGGAASGGAYERGLVEDVCAPGGLRPVPDKDKLASFLTAAKTLNPSVVRGLLDEKMSKGLDDGADNQALLSAAKAIAVVEAIAGAQGCEVVKKQLADECDVLLDLLENGEVKPSLRAAALRALRALGVDATEPAGLAATQAPAQQQVYVSPTPAPAPAPYVPAPAPAPAQISADLFGGLSFGAPAPAPAQTYVQAPTPAPALDIFGGHLGAGGMYAPAPAPVQPVAAVAHAFGGLNFGTPAPAPAPAYGGGASAVPVVPASNPMSAFMAAQQGQVQAPIQSLPMQAQGTGNGMGMGQTMSMGQQQLMMLQQQISAVTMHMASNPAAAAQLMPQLMALQQQQSAAMMAMSQLGGQGMQGMGMGMGGIVGMGMGMGGMGMGGMGMGQMGPMGMMPTVQAKPSAMQGAPAPAPAPAQRDAFDFASADLFGSK